MFNDLEAPEDVDHGMRKWDSQTPGGRVGFRHDGADGEQVEASPGGQWKTKAETT